MVTRATRYEDGENIKSHLWLDDINSGQNRSVRLTDNCSGRRCLFRFRTIFIGSADIAPTTGLTTTVFVHRRVVDGFEDGSAAVRFGVVPSTTLVRDIDAVDGLETNGYNALTITSRALDTRHSEVLLNRRTCADNRSRSAS